MSKRKTERASVPKVISIFPSFGLPDESPESKTEPRGNPKSDYKKKLLYPLAGIALFLLIGTGVMAKNGWLPSTDNLTGKKTGWFGKSLPNNASSSWNPMAVALVTATPQLSKEYIYAGSRMLAVEDANASAAPPADLAVWRPSSGYWYVLGGLGSQQTFTQFGSPDDKPVQGDYDGDGKTDFAVFRPSNGTWYIQPSGGGGFYGVTLGLSTDLPAQADFDGDGKTDPAVFRASNGTWYIARSSDRTLQINEYGTNGDTPVPKDFDGDGRDDVGIWRSNAASFYYLKSSNNNNPATARSIALGQSNDEPVPSDYDGDGRADAAVRRGADWIIRQSSNNQTQTVNWGAAGDIAVPNDYDGDGKVDIAVWGPGNGYWYIRQSQSLIARAVQWGITGDIPVPAYYRR